jgi:hypothetical protein
MIGPQKTVNQPNMAMLNNAEPSPASPNVTGLIKATIPPDAPESALDTQGDTKDESRPGAPDAGGEWVPKPAQAKAWEDEKVTLAALEKARSLPSVKKVQICYSDKDDEWSVALFDYIGNSFDVKQFFWNRDREALEPHLVLKRIPESRLQKSLEEKESGRVCEVLDTPNR